MSKYIIDTDSGTCTPFNTSSPSNVSDFLAQYEGTREYEGIVAEIQKWYYGSLVKAPWCATCMSWVFSKLGIPVDKAENVYVLMRNCQYAATQGHGQFFSRGNIPDLHKGDILFLLFSTAPMTTTSNKHVTAYVGMDSDGYCQCIGGNQSDMIKVSTYDPGNVYAVYRP